MIKDHYNILGFLDDNKTEQSIIGRFDDYIKHLGKTKFCSGMASWRFMSRRKNVLQQMPKDIFISFVADGAKIYPSANIGYANFVFPNSIISSGVTLGEHVLVYHNCVIAHDSNIGDFTIISNSATVSGKVYIGTNCYIGAGATILEEITIGDNSIIAAGATVTSAVESNSIYISRREIKRNHYIIPY